MFIVQNVGMITIILVSTVVGLIFRKFRRNFITFINRYLVKN